jgi:hypothetical protein
MDNGLYFALGILVGLVYTVAIVTIVISFPLQNKTALPRLGELRHRLESIQQEMHGLGEQIWDYGSSEEERSRRWRIACVAIAGKAVSVLQSCWLEREQDVTARAVHDELLLSLKSVGVEEINPSQGEKVDEDDRRYRIMKREGSPPYKVSKVFCPGYYLRPTLGKIYENQDNVILEPARIEVEGEALTTEV